MQPVGVIPRLYSICLRITLDLLVSFGSSVAALRSSMRRAPLWIPVLKPCSVLVGLFSIFSALL
jgi:hypothetical protein